MQWTSRRSSPSPVYSLLALISILRNHGFVVVAQPQNLHNHGYVTTNCAAQCLQIPWLRKLKIYSLILVIRARKDTTDEGEDLDCITLRPQMAPG